MDAATCDKIQGPWASRWFEQFGSLISGYFYAPMLQIWTCLSTTKYSCMIPVKSLLATCTKSATTLSHQQYGKWVRTLTKFWHILLKTKDPHTNEHSSVLSQPICMSKKNISTKKTLSYWSRIRTHSNLNTCWPESTVSVWNSQRINSNSSNHHKLKFCLWSLVSCCDSVRSYIVSAHTLVKLGVLTMSCCTVTMRLEAVCLRSGVKDSLLRACFCISWH